MRLDQYFGRLAARHLQPKLLLASSVYRFVDRVAGLVNDELPGHPAKLTDLVVLPSESL